MRDDLKEMGMIGSMVCFMDVRTRGAFESNKKHKCAEEHWEATKIKHVEIVMVNDVVRLAANKYCDSHIASMANETGLDISDDSSYKAFKSLYKLDNLTHDCVQIDCKCSNCSSKFSVTYEAGGSDKKYETFGSYKKTRCVKKEAPLDLPYLEVKRLFEEMWKEYDLAARNCKFWSQSFYIRLTTDNPAFLLIQKIFDMISSTLLPCFFDKTHKNGFIGFIFLLNDWAQRQSSLNENYGILQGISMENVDRMFPEGRPKIITKLFPYRLKSISHFPIEHIEKTLMYGVSALKKSFPHLIDLYVKKDFVRLDGSMQDCLKNILEFVLIFLKYFNFYQKLANKNEPSAEEDDMLMECEAFFESLDTSGLSDQDKESIKESNKTLFDLFDKNSLDFEGKGGIMRNNTSGIEKYDNYLRIFFGLLLSSVESEFGDDDEINVQEVVDALVKALKKFDSAISLAENLKKNPLFNEVFNGIIGAFKM